MKTIIRLAGILIIATLASSDLDLQADDAGQTPVNLLINSGFEAGINPWRDFGSGAVLETTDVKEGKTAVYLKKGAGVNYKMDGLKPSTKYRLTAKIKVEKAGESARLFAQGYDKNNAGGSSTLATVQDWTTVTLEFQTGATDTSCELGVWKDAGLGDGGAFVDDFNLVQE